jgi:membrane-associated phospholipid phosphatase
LLLFASVLLTVALVLIGDQRFTDWITSHTVYQLVFPTLTGVTAGAGALIFIAVLADRFDSRQWIGCIVPLLLSTGLTHLIKFIVGRARPRANLGAFHFEPFTPEAKVASFPSGHTSYAIAVVVLLCIHFPRWRPLFIFLGVCAGLERIILREHYLSDVLAGAALGAFSVWITMRVLGPQFYRKELPPRLS